jgi:flagellar biogenesis protein FliO
LTPKNGSTFVKNAGAAVSGTGLLDAPKKPAKQKDTGYLSDYDPDTSHKKDSEPSVVGSLLRVLLALIFVATLAYLSLLALKQIMSRKVTGSSPKQKLRVLETTGLGANRALHVVQIDGKRLLVGSTADRINLISELEPPSETDSAEAEQSGDFASLLSRFSSNGERANAATKLSGILRDGASFLQKKSNAAKSLREESGTHEK